MNIQAFANSVHLPVHVTYFFYEVQQHHAGLGLKTSNTTLCIMKLTTSIYEQLEIAPCSKLPTQLEGRHCSWICTSCVYDDNIIRTALDVFGRDKLVAAAQKLCLTKHPSCPADMLLYDSVDI